MAAEDWIQYGEAVLPDPEADARAGNYAVRTRRRRSCPNHLAVMKKAIDID
jgi:hypothetical protein